MKTLTLLLAFAAACQSTKVSTDEEVWQGGGQIGDAEVPRDTGVEQVGGADDSGDDEPTEDVENAGGVEHPLFSSTTIHEIELTLPRENLAALHLTPFDYTESDVTIDGVTLTDVGLRIKGKYGTYRDLDSKPSFKVDFNKYVEGQEYEGLEKLNLNNAIVDCGYNRDRVSYEVWRQLDLPYLRTGYAHVTINGEDYGLYVLIEGMDDEWLKRSFDDPSGNLYDGKYYMLDDWSWYTFVDFEDGLDDYYRLDEGTDVALADIKAITTAREEAAGNDELYAALDPLLNWDRILRHLAAEQWIGQNDGYGLNRNNYFVYFDPEDGGRASLTPWDLDYAFLAAEDWGYSWRRPTGKLLSNCLGDPECKAMWLEAVADVAATLDEAALIELAESSAALIEDAAMADPRRECADSSVTTYQDYVVEYLDGRSGELLRYWDLD